MLFSIKRRRRPRRPAPEILTQAMQVGEQFLPTIGKYAAQNMDIMQTDLQPLFAWLQGPGLSIFKNLESIFQSNLPAAMGAFDNGVELVLKVLDLAAQYTGGFIQWLDALFTKLNGPDWGQVEKTVGDLIQDFETWLHLFESIGKLLVDLFKPAVGAGEEFVSLLTGIFKQIDSWLTSAAGKSILHDLFTADIESLKALGDLLQAVLPFIESFLDAWLQIRAVGSVVLAGFLTALTDLLKLINDIPFGATILGWALALGIAGNGILNFAGSAAVLVRSLLGIPEAGAAAAAATTAVDASFTASSATMGAEWSAMSAEVVADSEAIGTAFGLTADEIVAGVTEADTALASLDAMIATTRAEMVGLGESGGIGAALGGLGGGEEAASMGLLARGGAALAAIPWGAIGAGVAVADIALHGLAAIAPGMSNLTDQQTAATDKATIAYAKSATNIAQVQAGQVSLQGQIAATTQAMDEATNSGTGLSNVALHIASAFGFTESNAAQMKGQLDNLNSAYQQGQSAIATYGENVSSLSAKFGLTKTQAEVLATSMGINLTQALNPSEWNTFAQTVQQDMQQTGGVAGAVSAIISNDMAVMASNANVAANNMHITIKGALEPLVGDLTSIGQNSTAALIQEYINAAGPAGVAGKNLHDKTVQPLEPLVTDLLGIGQDSAAGMVQGVINNAGPAASAAKDLHDGIFNALSILESQLAASGNTAAATWVNQFIMKTADAAAAAKGDHDAILNELSKLVPELGDEGNQGVAAYIQALANGETPAQANAAALVAAAIAGLGTNPTESQILGAEFGQGFVNGINAQLKAASEAGGSLVWVAEQAVYTNMVGGSPSRLMMERGADFAEGWILGIQGKLGAAQMIGAALAAVTSGAALAAVGSSLSLQHETLATITQAEGATRHTMQGTIQLV